MFLLLLALGIAPAYAQPRARLVAPGWLMEHWGARDGLPSDAIYSLAVDDQGRVILGTAHGLGLWDGRGFTVQRVGAPMAPPDNRAFFVANDEEGGLWVITEAGRVQRRAGGSVTDFGLLGPTVRPQKVRDLDGPLLVLTGQGVYELRDRPILREDLPADADDVIDHGTTTYVGGEQGWFRRDDPAGPWEALDPEEAATRIGDYHGLRFAEGPFRVDADGIFLGADRIHSFESLPTDMLLFEDEVWVSTGGEGLLRLRPTPLRVHLPQGASEPRVDQVVQDGASGEIWASLTDNRAWWSPARPSVLVTATRANGEEPRPLRNGTVPLTAGGARWWWVAGELHRQRSGVAEATLPLDEAESPLCADRLTASLTLAGGDVLTGTGLRFTGGRWTALPGACAPPFQWVQAMADLGHAGLLLGGRGGLTLLSPDSREPQVLPGPEGLRVRHLRLDGGWIWMSAEHHGLCALRTDALRQGSWRCLGAEQGLDEPDVHASLADDLGRTWISTNRGLRVANSHALAAFAEGNDDELALLSLAESWGLDNAEFNGMAGFSAVDGGDGSFWFPSQGGLVEVRSGELRLPEAIRVSFAQAPPGTLPPGHDPVELELVVHPLAWAPSVQLRYRLNDGPWRRAAGRIELQALPPGRSHLEVQARLLGDWARVASADLRREPAFTERAIFPLLPASVVLAMLLVAIALRNRSLRRHADALAREVARQTATLALQNQALNSQAARLTELDELKTRFIADLAHELRTPLTLVRGALELPGGDPSLARRNVDRLQTLIEELFDLTRLETGTLRLRARRIDLVAFAAGVAARFSPSFASAGRSLHFENAEAPVVVWVDTNLLDKVLSNLLANALRHGSGATTVKVLERGGQARLSVQDEGAGVPAPDRERIFERFTQLSGGDSRAHEGAGIGLALAKELVELHGGEIQALDQALFEVRLPLGQAHLGVDDIDLQGPADPAPLPAPELPPGEGELLLVEDNDELRAYLAGLLGERWTVRQARDGRQALALARARRPRAIVSDIRMPVLDGLSMAKALRADPSLASIPLLFLSAKTQPEDRVEGLTLAQDYLCKPFGAAELVARVQNLLQGSQREPRPTARPKHEQDFLDALHAAVQQQLGDPAFGVAELARRLAMSTRSLQERMKELDLPPPVSFLLEARLRQGQAHLRAGTFRTVGEVAAAVGLSRSYFARAYLAWVGHPPSQEVAGGEA